MLMLLAALALAQQAQLEVTADRVVPPGATFTCTPTRVWNGIGPIWCAEGPKVRLWGLAVRELDDRCLPNRPCPRRSGSESRDFLISLLGRATGTASSGHVLVEGASLHCIAHAFNEGGKTSAWCRSATAGDLSCAMAQAGYASPWRRHGGASVCNPSVYEGASLRERPTDDR